MLGAAPPPRLRTSFYSDQSTYDIIWSSSMHAHHVWPTNTLYGSLSFAYARRILILVVISLPYHILDVSYHLLILIFPPIIAFYIYHRYSRSASSEGQEDS